MPQEVAKSLPHLDKPAVKPLNTGLFSILCWPSWFSHGTDKHSIRGIGQNSLVFYCVVKFPCEPWCGSRPVSKLNLLSCLCMKVFIIWLPASLGWIVWWTTAGNRVCCTFGSSFNGLRLLMGSFVCTKWDVPAVYQCLHLELSPFSCLPCKTELGFAWSMCGLQYISIWISWVLSRIKMWCRHLSNFCAF